MGELVAAKSAFNVAYERSSELMALNGPDCGYDLQPSSAIPSGAISVSSILDRFSGPLCLLLRRRRWKYIVHTLVLFFAFALNQKPAFRYLSSRRQIEIHESRLG